MKKILIIIFSSVICASCQELKSKTYTLEATVIDQDSAPVEEATIGGSSEKIVIRNTITMTDYEPIHVKTDFEGKAKLALLRYTETPTGVLVEKDGYYTTRQAVVWPYFKKNEKSTLAATKIMLKKIMNPVAMHAKEFTREDIIIPSLNKKYEYDLMVQDFLPPAGKGKVADVYITAIGESDGEGKANIELSIEAKEDESGFVKFINESREYGSQLWSDYIAPNEGYTPSITLYYNSSNREEHLNKDISANYYFRVRGKTNPVTKIKEWNYGKIYGPISLFAMKKEWIDGDCALRLSAIYFNPLSGDRNVEFDTKRNLNLSSPTIRP
jgi:hypothetical protein